MKINICVKNCRTSGNRQKTPRSTKFKFACRPKNCRNDKISFSATTRRRNSADPIGVRRTNLEDARRFRGEVVAESITTRTARSGEPNSARLNRTEEPNCSRRNFVFFQRKIVVVVNKSRKKRFDAANSLGNNFRTGRLFLL